MDLQHRENEMRVLTTVAGSRSTAKSQVAVLSLLCGVMMCLASLSVCAQFLKEEDERGHVTYRDDPSYDYAADEPAPENQRIHAEQMQRLGEFLHHRENLSKRDSRSPETTTRTGRAVCRPRLSLSNPRAGCPQP